jgi:Flp pilus assembly protein TadD
LQAARTRQDLDEPYRLAAEVADANPAVRGPQHLAAVIAYRAGRWEDAVRYFRRGGDPGEDDAETLFYMAVSLYEAGEPEAAAEALRRSLPRIEHTPFVRSYEAKILGEASEASEPGATP